MSAVEDPEQLWRLIVEARLWGNAVFSIFESVGAEMTRIAIDTLQQAQKNEESPLHVPVRFAALYLQMQAFNREVEEVATRMESEPPENFDHLDRRVVEAAAARAAERRAIPNRARDISRKPRPKGRSPLRALVAQDMKAARAQGSSLKGWMKDRADKRSAAEFNIELDSEGRSVITGRTPETETLAPLKIEQATLYDYWREAKPTK